MKINNLKNTTTSGLRRLRGAYFSSFRYAVFRWLMPHLRHNPLYHMNMAQKAWPKIAALTAGHKYTDQIESINCGISGYDDSSHVLEEYAKTSRPIVLKNYIVVDKEMFCTLEGLKGEIGNIDSRVRVGNYDEDAGDPEFVPMQVSDFIDHLQGNSEFPYKNRLVEGKGPYLANMKFPTIAKQLPIPSLFPKPPDLTVFWLGSDSRTPLHSHTYCDVLLVQLIGRRRVILIPPHQAPLIGSIPRDANVCTASFDPFEPDKEKFPGSDLVHKLYFELDSGDALLIPGFWYHAVRLAGPSFASSQFNLNVMPSSIGGGPRKPWNERSYSKGWG